MENLDIQLNEAIKNKFGIELTEKQISWILLIMATDITYWFCKEYFKNRKIEKGSI